MYVTHRLVQTGRTTNKAVEQYYCRTCHMGLSFNDLKILPTRPWSDVVYAHRVHHKGVYGGWV